MFMRSNRPQSIQEASWWEERCVRRQGGYDLDMSNLPQDVRWLPKGVVYKFDASTGRAQVVKSCKVIAEAKSGATSLEVAANHLLNVGDKLGENITITAITHGTDKDTLTVSGLAETIKANTVLTDLKATDVKKRLKEDGVDLIEVIDSMGRTQRAHFINDEIKDAINKYGYARFRII